MLALKLNHVSKKVPVDAISGITGVTPDLEPAPPSFPQRVLIWIQYIPMLTYHE